MIRFSAFLVVVAVGLLVAGVVTSKLLLVYIAIGVSGVALLALGIGAAVNWRELTGKTAETSAQGPAAQAAAPEAATSQAATSQAQPPQVPVPAGSVPAAGSAPAGSAPAIAGSGWPAAAPSGPSRPGYLPATEAPRPKPESRPGAQPPGSRPDDVPRAPAAFTPRREPSAPGAWEFRDNTIQAPPAAAEAPAPSAAPPTSPQPVVKPVPPREEDTAEPSPTAERDQPPAKEQPPEPAPGPEPVSGADPASEPELTLVPGATAAASAPATSQAERPEQDEQAAEAEPAGPDPTMEVTVVPGVPRYHNAHCILIRFMGDSDLDKMTLAAARKVGCTPCRACLPDQPDKSPE